MRLELDQTQKKLLIIFGVLVLVFIGIKIYDYWSDKQEQERYAVMLEKMYESNPGLKDEHQRQEELLRLYGPRALAEDFSPNQSNALNQAERKVVKNTDGSEKITVLYDSGKPKEEYFMKDGKLTGIFKSWDDQGRLVEESEYLDNVLNGTQKGFYTNGLVKTETTYVNGQKNGPTKNWYQNGKQSSETEYKNNKKIGATSFYPDGTIRTKETLNDATNILLTEAFYTNGQLSHSFGTLDGKREGLLIKNAPSGFQVAEANYKNGIYDGWCRVWNEDGKLDIELLYKNGQIDHSVKSIGKSCDIDIWRFGFR